MLDKRAFLSAFAKRLKVCSDKVGGKGKLAKMAGISNVQISRYFNGKSSPSVTNVWAISEAAEMDLFWLMTGEGKPDRPTIKAFAKHEIYLPEPELFIQILELLETVTQEYQILLPPSLKAQITLFVYKSSLAKLAQTGEKPDLNVGILMETIAFLTILPAENAYKMLLHAPDIMQRIYNNELPEPEIQTFLNTICAASKAVPSHKNMKYYFERIGSLNAKDISEMDSFMAKIEQQAPKKIERILDLGSGNGRYFEYFIKNYADAETYALDGNKDAVQLCENIAKRYKLETSKYVIESDVRQTPFPDYFFDFIYCTSVLEFIPFLEKYQNLGAAGFMKEMERLLSPGGLGYIYTRHGDGFDFLDFAQGYNPTILQEILNHTELEILSLEKVSYTTSISHIHIAKGKGNFSGLRLLVRKN